MAEPGERRAERPANEVQARTAGFREYAAARQRYFERLRIDSEIRRLEQVWRMTPGATPRGRAAS